MARDIDEEHILSFEDSASRDEIWARTILQIMKYHLDNLISPIKTFLFVLLGSFFICAVQKG